MLATTTPTEVANTQLANAVTFQTLLKTHRAAAALSYDALGGRARVDPAYLLGLENGKKNNPSRDIVIRIGIGLGLDIDGLDELVSAAGHIPLLRTRSANQNR